MKSHREILTVYAVAKKFVRRGRFEIANEILSLCHTPSQKTHILYKCNLSFEQLEKYLDYLISNNLLESFSKDGKVFYRLTGNGRRFIKKYKRLNRFLGTRDF